MNLDLYAKIEPLIGFDDAYEELYELYLSHLRKLNVKNLLDVGCGSGRLLEILKNENISAKGIDLSPKMVQRCQSKQLDVECMDICKVEEKYEAVVAVADVLNYMDEDELQGFLECVKKVIQPKGYFLADVNSLHGFENVADGTVLGDREDLFFGVDATFENGKLYSEFTLFSKLQDGNFKKEQDEIIQYYHSVLDIEEMLGMKRIAFEDVMLFDDVSDKTLMIFQKE